MRRPVLIRPGCSSLPGLGLFLQQLPGQALAALFYRSGWTQEQLATVEKCTRQSVAYRLRFGRFLAGSGNTTTVVIPPDLTERRFRGYWEQTDKGEGNERGSLSQAA